MSKQKESWTEDLFLDVFNEFHPKFYLLKCSQDYNTFDYWMVEQNEREAHIVELKCRPGKKAFEDRYAMLDYLKIVKLRALAIGLNVYVFFLYEDKTLIFDTAWVIDKFRETIWNNNSALLAGWFAEKAKSIPIGLKDLRKIQRTVSAEHELAEKLDAMSQETLTPAPQENSPESQTLSE